MRLTIVGLFLVFLAGTGLADSVLTGNWIGTVNITEKQIPVRVHFNVAQRTTNGTITLPMDRIYDQPLSAVSVKSGSVHFELKIGDLVQTFDGKIQNRQMQGNFTMGEAKGNFELLQLATVDPKTTSRYYGMYQLEPNRFLYIRTWDELGDNRLTYFDNTGNIGALLPSSKTDFFWGPSLLIPSPVTKKIRFGKKDSQTGLWFQENGNKERFARRIQPFTEEECRIKNGAVTLAGTLFVPATKGSHPAMVLVHGSNSVTRDFFGPIAYDFVRKGIAVLAYDKRGAGGSTGHWMDSDFQDLAEDALAAVRFLKNRNDIDGARIGLWGISQGGWIAPLAASKSNDVAFLMLVSAPSVKPYEQEIQRQEAELRAQQIPENKIAEMSAELRSQIDSLRSPDSVPELQQDLKKLQNQHSGKLLAASSLDNPRFLLWYRAMMDYDPAIALQKIKCPVLLVYGDRDQNVPEKQNRIGFERAFKNSGNQSVTIRVFPHANHAMLQCRTGSEAEFPYLTKFVPGFFDFMTGWIMKTTRMCKPGREAV